MSGRASRWVLFVVLPIVLALYASYPPVGVPIEKVRITTKIAQTEKEAKAHNVQKGQRYEVSREVLWKRFLPFAFGKKSFQTAVVETRADGTVVEERTVSIRPRVKLGLDVAGGTELLYELKPQKGQRVAGKVADVIEILKRRIDPAQVKEFRIQAVGQDRILIQIPRATPAEVEQYKKRLSEMGKLEFKLAVPRGSGEAKFNRLYAEADAGRVPEGYEKMVLQGDPEHTYYLVKKGPPEITGDYLAPGKLRPVTDRFGRPAVGFEFDPVGARKFAQITETNRGWCLAIILDGVLKSAPLIEERIAGAGQITGSFTEQEVKDMLNVLRSGSLPMDIELLQESTVGPQIGRDSIRRGLRSLAVAGVLVLTFIGIYYMACGMIADAALIMNLVLLIGVMCVLGAALTLPGMAGILLTVGMAVDANVLIFERIREESAGGKVVRVALRNGYERAFTTIVDANVTTLLTAIILYVVGTGPVKGFAVTLSFGILLSMFTALVVTRLAFETMIERGLLTAFKMFSIIRRPNISFSALRKPAYVLSAGAVVVGLVVFFARGSALYDIDFTGGTLVRLSFARAVRVEEIRSRLAAGGFTHAQVQGIRTAGATGDRLKDFSIRLRGTAGEVATRTLLPQVRELLTKAGILKKGDRIALSRDGRALELDLQTPVEEMALRRALAGSADLEALEQIGTIVPADDVRSNRVTVSLPGERPPAERRRLWGRMLRALAWAEMETDDYTVEKCELKDTEPPRIELRLDKPLSAQVLAAELDQRQFPQINPEPAGADGTAFTLRADRETLERFAREFPAGSRLNGVPVATIEDTTVTASLGKEFSEDDIRAYFRKQNLGDVYISMLGAPSSAFRLVLSAEPVRQKMRTLFGDLAGSGAQVRFEPEGQPDESGRLRVKLVLPERMVFADVQYYLGAAGVGADAGKLIIEQKDISPNASVTDVILSLPADRAEQIEKQIQAAFSQPEPVQEIQSIGSAVAKEMQGRALLAVVFASVIIIFYVAVRFHAFRFGVAAVIALVHDISITAGVVALADWCGLFGNVKINLASLAAFLTILGYSLNDTIVVFDRIRENLGKAGRKRVDESTIDQSINQTLSRTLLTSLTTLAVVVVLYFMGGPVLQALAFPLMVGVVVGTYSSVFIASPIVLDWASVSKGLSWFFRIVFLPVTLPFKLLGMLLGAGR